MEFNLYFIILIVYKINYITIHARSVISGLVFFHITEKLYLKFRNFCKENNKIITRKTKPIKVNFQIRKWKSPRIVDWETKGQK